MFEDESFDEEREEDTSNRGEWGGVDGQLILIDVSKNMWRGDKENSVRNSLLATLMLVRQMLVSGGGRLLGLALFGTLRNDDRGLENVVQVFELRRPTVDNIQSLKDYCSDENEIRNTWGSADAYNFADALWLTANMFSQCKKKMSRQTVTILSCFTEPDENLHRVILKKASDLPALQIDVRLINVSDMEISQNSIFRQLGSIFTGEPVDEWIPPQPNNDPDEILALIWQNTHKKSASSKLKFHLSADLAFGVGVYHLCKPKLPPKKVILHRETNDRLEANSKTFCSGDEDKPVLRSELCMYQTYGERQIEFTYGEHMQLKKFGGNPRIELLGFKPTSILTMSKYYLKPCAFLYPDESTIIGSTKLFRCLRDRCIAKSRVAICIMVARWYSHPRLVALVPQEEIINDRKQSLPDGFHVIYLPYRENIKDLNLEESKTASEEQLTCMKSIIKKVRFIFNPNIFENPKLQYLYSAIEALALDEEDAVEPTDTTVPDTDVQREKLKSLPAEFVELFGRMEMGTKRKNTGADPESRKKPAVAVEPPDLDMLKDRISRKMIHKYKVDDLKKILKWSQPDNLPALTGLKKDDLVELVYTHCTL